MFLITAFPRSGTKYVAEVLKSVGLDVGHEEIRPDGVVSWAHAGYGNLSWIGDIEPIHPDTVIHLVRDPLKVISSAQTLRNESFDYMFKIIGHPGGPRGLRWYMWAWLKWNEFIEGWEPAGRFKVEDLDNCHNSLFEKIGVDAVLSLPDISKTTNTRPHPDYTWTDLKRADKKLYKLIRAKAKEYGYDQKPEIKIPKISAIMMMRNEAHNLRRCLDSIKNVVDEICIVDTAMPEDEKDDSPQIAKEYGAKILSSPWQSDFALHRNQSISLASGEVDWLLQIDCDEEFFIDDPMRFKRFLGSLGPEVNGVALSMRDIIKGKEPMVFNPVRVFRAGKVHFEKCVQNEAIFDGASPLYPNGHFNHYGYDLTPEQWEVKHNRTIPLLRKRLEDPEDKNAHYFLSQSLPAIGEHDEAIEHAEKYIASRNGSKDFQDSVYYTLIQLYIKKDNLQKACETLDAAVKVLPNDLDIAKIQVEIGNMIKRPDVILNGAIRYVHNYDRMQKDPAMIGNRFCYSNTPESNIYCSFNALFVMLSDACNLKKRIEANLDSVSEDFKTKTITDMETNLKRFGVTIGGNDGV